MASSGVTAALRCEGLVKRFEDVVAVAGVDLEVQRGECFGLLGPNGAGKTTTVEILEGLTPADAGTVEVLGTRWGSGDDTLLRRRLGIQLQQTELGDKQTVEEVARLFRSFYPSGRFVDDVIRLVELEPKRRSRVHKLSGGQKQRLALACALVGSPDVLFLDEPTTGLDPQARMQTWEVVEEFRRGGGTVILTTHYMEEAASLCDRIAIMDHGKVIAEGTPQELIASLGAQQIVEIEVDGDLAADELEALPCVIQATRRVHRWVLAVESVAAAMPVVLDALQERGVALESLATHQATLDDVFLHLTGRGLRDE